MIVAQESINTEEKDANIGSRLESLIREIGIPPCPSILCEISNEIKKDEPDIKFLAKTISSDVGVSASLIALANSPYFGSRTYSRSVQDVLMVLGLKVAGRAIAGLMLRELFPLSPTMERFWHASGCIARLSGWLAQNYPSGLKIRPEDAYTFALFRDCGIPLLLHKVDRYSEALQKANSDADQSFTDVEDAICFLNHAEIGGLMTQGWYLPDEISIAICHHHDYSQLGVSEGTGIPAYSQGLIATSLLAEHIYQYHTNLSQTCEWQKGGIASLQVLGISADSLPEIYDACKDAFD